MEVDKKDLLRITEGMSWCIGFIEGSGKKIPNFVEQSFLRLKDLIEE